MEEEKSNTKTAFDAAFQNHQLELIKTAVPYISTSEQKFMSIFIKFSELMDTITIFQRAGNGVGICALEEKEGTVLDMLNDIKSVCTKPEKETVNMLINFLNAFQLYNTYKNTMEDNDLTAESTSSENSSGNMFEVLKELLSPEQQKMFETYSILLNS